MIKNYINTFQFLTLLLTKKKNKEKITHGRKQIIKLDNQVVKKYLKNFFFIILLVLCKEKKIPTHVISIIIFYFTTTIQFFSKFLKKYIYF